MVREVSQAERELLRRAAELPGEVPRTALAAALEHAGLVGPKVFDLGSQEMVGGEITSAVQFLTGLVMVPGQFGLKVPLVTLDEGDADSRGQWTFRLCLQTWMYFAGMKTR